jgi:hypothetical protein
VGSAHDPTAVRPNEYSLTPPQMFYIKFFEKCRMNYLYNETNLQNGEGYVGSTNHEPHPNSKQANGAHYRARLATET